ncbi:MAG: hypothetical protein KIH67_002760 [Candidatus Moranbacteria bacterium]|nr:hypothetical protein [Candidatus Moranbacteria bacterium]
MNIIGHTKERQYLESIVQRKNISQMYLFLGPESIGKNSVAFDFACALVGEPSFEASAEKPMPLNVRVLEPEMVVRRGVARKKTLGVLLVREELRILKTSPGTGRYTVLIVRDAHLLTQAAQNLLLKFSEEPDATAVIIFVTHDRSSLLETLCSRLEEIRFRFVGENILKKEGKEHGLMIGTDIPDFFFQLGRPGILFQAKENPKRFLKKKEQLTKLFRLSALSLRERLALAEELAVDVPSSIQLLEWFIPGLYQKAKTLSAENQAKHLLLVASIQETLFELKRADVQPRMTLEHLFLSLR